MEKVMVWIISRVSHSCVLCSELQALLYSYCIEITFRYGDTVSNVGGSSVWCWGSTSADMCSFCRIYKMEHHSGQWPGHNWRDHSTVNSNSGDTSQQISQRVINSTTFTFMRSSAQNGPLISTLSIDSVSIGLNGTVVRCVEVGGSMLSSASTIIHIIGGINSELINARLSCIVSPLS